jgi:hypothetical protein
MNIDDIDMFTVLLLLLLLLLLLPLQLIVCASCELFCSCTSALERNWPLLIFAAATRCVCDGCMLSFVARSS